ncbi:MAG: hypothetical protein WBA63_01865 [Thermomicrobiales bacterium]
MRRPLVTSATMSAATSPRSRPIIAVVLVALVLAATLPLLPARTVAAQTPPSSLESLFPSASPTPRPGAVAASADNPPGVVTPDEQALVAKYLPVVYVRQQDHPCAAAPEGGEPYRPVPVEMVLGNPRVELRDGAEGDRVLATGVGATDLAAYGPDTYLDFPGDPRRPGCTYETDERQRTQALGLRATTYSRMVVDEASQRLVLQYWFFWYFNQWNNTHEADWEMMQIMWDDTGSVAEALRTEPSRVGYSQHSSGELSAWDDSKLTFDDGPSGTHLRIFSGAGSHASFYSQRTFLQWGENSSGFGCDITVSPSVRVSVEAKIVAEPIDPTGEFGWLLYPGRWGERQLSVFNGVHGPGYNSRWISPWETTDRWNSANIVVPTRTTFGPTATDAFCAASRAGSQVLIATKVHPWLALPIISFVVAALAFFYIRARSFFRRGVRIYRTHWRIFAGIGLVAIPIGIISNLIQAYLVVRNPVRFVVYWLGDTAGAELSTVLAIGGFQQIAMLALIGPAVIQAMVDIHRGERPGVKRSYLMAASRVGPIVIAALIVAALAGLSLLTVIGVPVAIWLVVRWQFFGQALLFNRDCSGPEALHESARLIKRRWWKSLFASLLFDLMATLPGVLVGFGLLTLGRTAVGFANGVSSVFYALLMPLSIIALTVMYLDWRNDPLATGAESQPAEPSSEAVPGDAGYLRSNPAP